ncbi:acyltransferase [Colwellia asteriadis]|uniref:Acyltransferase n=1 Tax=Colwellia asteriadis TaxID=517723 RepID=A0ABN1L7G6_9GAMM
MKTRFYEIDLLRFLSAFAVVIFHYTYTGYMEGFAKIADFEALRVLTRYAYMGINFFFIISGFVIFMSVADGSPKNFLISRFVRLFPAYWCALALTAIFTVLWGAEVFHITWPQLLANVTMVNELLGYKPIESAYWTLYIELKFYLLILIVLSLGMMKYFQHVIAITLLASFLMLFHPWAKNVDMFVAIFPHWSGYFAAGGVFYLLRRDGLNGYRSLLLLLSYAFVIKQSILFGNLMSSWFNITFNSTVIFAINTLFFALFCVTALCEKNPLRQRYFYYLGVLTYPLYLVHQHIGYMVFNLLGNQENIALVVTITVILMLLVAYLIHTQIEVKIGRRLKKTLTSKPVVTQEQAAIIKS